MKKRRVTIDIAEELYIKFKMLCAENDTSMSHAIRMFVEQAVIQLYDSSASS